MALTKPGSYNLVKERRIRHGNDWSITLKAPYSITNLTYTAYICKIDDPTSVKAITVVKDNDNKTITLSLSKTEIISAELTGQTWRWLIIETSDADFTKTIGDSLIEFEE